MTRTVEDAARVFAVIAGYDPADSVTEAIQARAPAAYVDALDVDGLSGVRIGVLRALVDTPRTDPEVRALMDRALADMVARGAVLVDPLEIPLLDTFPAAAMWCSRFRYDLDRYLAGREGSPVKTLSEIFTAGLFDPTAEADIRRELAIAGAPEDQQPPCVDVDGDPRRSALRDAVLAAMDAADVTAVVYPAWSGPPRRAGDYETPAPDINSSYIAPHTGQPAIVVPMGVTSGNLPAGLEIVGRPFSEADLFRVAYAYEQATHHRKPPPLFPALAE
jgi:Asp-tRNA(Asn)/Glu-tRNA(Gln) amidotransferase A subunit family amidase